MSLQRNAYELILELISESISLLFRKLPGCASFGAVDACVFFVAAVGVTK